MKTLGNKYRAILKWHRRSDRHPLFSLRYSGENLASLAQTIVMLYLYFLSLMTLLHFLATIGFMESETLIWYIAETNARRLYFALPDKVFLDPFIALGFLLATLLITVIIHFGFDILKANLHPGANKSFRKFLKSYRVLPKTKPYFKNLALKAKNLLLYIDYRLGVTNSKLKSESIPNIKQKAINLGQKLLVLSKLKLRTKGLKLNQVSHPMIWLGQRLKKPLSDYSKAFRSKTPVYRPTRNRSRSRPSPQP